MRRGAAASARVCLLLCMGWALCLAGGGPAFAQSAAQSAKAADTASSQSADPAEADLSLDLPERPKPRSLDELLGLVKHGFQEERAEKTRPEKTPAEKAGAHR